MNSNEFSNQFDVLYNNISNNQAPGLNEYEKSVFLTKAEYELVKNHFSPESNSKQKGFDDTFKRDSDFSTIVRYKIIPLTSVDVSNFDPRAYKIVLEDKVFITLNEQLRLVNTDTTPATPVVTVEGVRQVIPISYDEYTRLMSKPYKEPLKYQAWRLRATDGTLSPSGESGTIDNSTIELIVRTADKKWAAESSNNSLSYAVRYVKKPNPIILESFESVYGEDVSIEGQNTPIIVNGSPCELNPMLHEEVLQRAVELAKVAWSGDQNDIQASITAGQRSE